MFRVQIHGYSEKDCPLLYIFVLEVFRGGYIIHDLGYLETGYRVENLLYKI